VIISHKNKFIFIKGRKIAGTAIEIALSGICGPLDIITPISDGDEAMRLNLGCGAKNYMNVRMTDIDGSYRLEERYYNHMSIREVPFPLGNYKVWTVDRHPYSKVLSQAGYLECSIDEVLRDKGKTPLNWPLYCDHDGSRLAHVYKYGQLNEVEKEFGIKLPRAKENHRKEYELTKDQKEWTQKVFEHEFKLLGWSK